MRPISVAKKLYMRNSGLKNRKMKKSKLLILIVLLVATLPLPAANRPIRNEYVPNEIIVKFRRNVADVVREQLRYESSARQLKLSRELDKLIAQYRVRQIKPFFKHFRQNRSRVKALQQKSEMLLNARERRILMRLKRAPQGTKGPDLDRIFILDLETGQSLAGTNCANTDYV